MATKSKKTAAKRSSSKTNHSRKKNNSASFASGITVRDEIVLWLVLAVSILTLISNFGFGGFVGNGISYFFFGLFGLSAYILPFALFFTVAFIISNKQNSVAKMKSIAIIVLWICFCALLELFLNGYISGQKLGEYYTVSATTKSGGGLIGGLLTKPLSSALGIAGTYVILIVFCIICIIIITERSMMEGMKNSGTKVYQTAKKDADYRREKAALRKEKRRIERERRMEEERLSIQQQQDDLAASQKEPRRDRKVTGVTMNTIVGETPTVEALPLEEPQKQVESKPENEGFSFTIQRSEPSGEMKEYIPAVPEFLSDIPKPLEDPFEQIEESEDEYIEITVPQEITKTREKNPKSSKKEQEEGIQSVAQEIEETAKELPPEYVFPPINLLKKPGKGKGGDSNKQLLETAKKLQQTLHDFGVEVSITNVSCGPSVTRYELTPNQGVKVSRIVNLADDIKLNLAAADIRIEAPIPGKSAVGIEVPNKENSPVMLRELLESEDFQNHSSNLVFAAGKDIAGKAVVADIAKMPHLLIAGATGSGKSVCINTIIMSILYKAKPEDVKLIMIDPKVVELSVYNGIPHLFIPVVTDPKKAAGALNWAVAEMTDRYEKFAELNVRDLAGYNKKVESIKDIEEENKPKKLPQILIIVDELADLMMVAPGEVEDAICRLAQLARAAGIHLVIATQRPSVNVITGLIKANMPSRIAFAVSSGVDSRTIIDMNGAEKLLGKGDMLFYPQGYQKPARVQGAFVSDGEVSAVVEYLTQENSHAGYSQEIQEQLTKVQQTVEISSASGGNERDIHFEEAGKFIIEKEKASIGMLQRVYKIGFNRAARIMDQLCEAGVVGPEEGTKPRKVLMTMEEFEKYLEESV